MAESIQPHWHIPYCEKLSYDVGLMVMNSLTRRKEKFVTINGGRSVKWYMCGPTVYAPSHMGHARTYLGFDIIRRILTSHFGYDVTLAMNITDLDDKIIQRAHEHGITCEELSQQYESEFHEDMAYLDVIPPDVLMRVTEYMEEIVLYIRTIVDKGLAYESNGSVYFSVSAFNQLEEMNYCKLEPEQSHTTNLLAEGEGKLTNDFIREKRSPRDFALWKRSKEGDPKWPSPWGEGRPGWHIECSVMASEIFARLSGAKCADDIAGEGKCCMDIHSGGVDLKFPHHDNEMAQAEAHSGCKQWVNYFIHAGHLHIKGFKMSKSLKNFITIRQALEQHTPRQIRICFLLHKYNAPMDYGDNTMAHAISMERIFVEFFHNVKVVLRRCKIADVQKWDVAAGEMQVSVESARKAVDEALQDDFDTPTCIMSLADLVGFTNRYVEGCDKENQNPVGLVVRNSAQFVTHVFRVFGLIPDSVGMDIGFPMGAGGTKSDTRGAKITGEEMLTPVLDALLKFRSVVRENARVKNVHGVLAACDAFRDDELPPLGIRLEDKNPPVWKLVDPEEIMRQQEHQKQERRRKETEKYATAEVKAQKEALNKLCPEEFMKQLSMDDDTNKLKYSNFDQMGIPTHFYDGTLLNKSQIKKAQKHFQNQKKKYEKYSRLR